MKKSNSLRAFAERPFRKMYARFVIPTTASLVPTELPQIFVDASGSAEAKDSRSDIVAVEVELPCPEPAEQIKVETELRADLVRVEVELLSAELDRLSTEAQTFTTLIASFVGSLLVSVGALVALVARSDEKKTVDDWQWGTVGLLPLLISGYSVAQFARSVLRSAYARRTERAIAALLTSSYGTLDEVEGAPAIPFFETLTIQLESMKRGDGAVKGIMSNIWVAIACCLIGICGFVLKRMESFRYVMFFSIVYAAVITPMSVLIWRTLSSTSLATRAFSNASAEVQGLNPTGRPKVFRSLAGYLFMPRPNDFVIKAIGLHGLSTAVGVAVSWNAGNGAKAVSAGLAVLLCFEFLGYQARYMVNDWLGKSSDSTHPVQGLRRRLPIFERSSMGDRKYKIRTALFWGSFSARTVLALVLPFVLLEKQLDAQILIGCEIGIVMLALLYEHLRKRTKDNAHLGRNSWSVFTCVGVSYGLRAAMGMWFGSGGLASLTFILSVSGTFYLVGLAIVLMGWVLEATSFLPDSEPTPGPIDQRLQNKAHLVYLGRRVGLFHDVSHKEAYRTESIASEAKTRSTDRPLLGTQRSWQPWEIAIVLASGMSIALGSSLVRGAPFTIQRCELLGIPFGLVVGAISIGRGFEGTTNKTKSTFRLGLIAAPLLIAMATQFGRAGWNTLWIPIPLVAVLLTYQTTRQMNYLEAQSLPETIAGIPPKIAAFISEICTELFR
jgi:hypothetical protein